MDKSCKELKYDTLQQDLIIVTNFCNFGTQLPFIWREW